MNSEMLAVRTCEDQKKKRKKKEGKKRGIQKNLKSSQ